jgi:site-specific DNA-methyltransferase (adenine-specific)
MSLPQPYYQDDACTIYHGDCREILPLLERVDLVLTDPPYGIGWKRGARGKYRPNSQPHKGIQGDQDTSVRDEALSFIKGTPWLVFGSFYAPYPESTKQVLVYHKPPYSGLIGANTPFRRDVEPIFLGGVWPKTIPISTSVLHAANGLNGSGETSGHPHTKPLSVILQLLNLVSQVDELILDPFMGSGTTLRAAKDLGRRAIGIELEERYCEIAANRLRQEVLL